MNSSALIHLKEELNSVLRMEDDSTQYKYGIFWFNYDNQKTAIFMYKIYLMIQIK